MKKIWVKLLDSCDWLWALFKFSLFLLVIWLCVKSLGTSAVLVELAFKGGVPWWIGVYAGSFIVFFLFFMSNDYVFLSAFIITFLNLWMLHYYDSPENWFSLLMPCPGLVCV